MSDIYKGKTGVPMLDNSTNSRDSIYNENEQLDISREEKDQLLFNIRAMVNKHTLCDEDWTEAISSQNFLVDLAFELGMTRDKTFRDLLNIFLSSFSPQFSGGFKLNERNVLIIPDENQKLIECMLKEDQVDSYYHGALEANKIAHPDHIYKNYLYGLMVNIATATVNNQLSNVFDHCINELLSDEALDKDRGGWYHYRLPWITARILLGFHNILKNDRLTLDIIDKIVNLDNKGLSSLIERIYDNKYWRSGAGEWVSKWESTGLCLEAFLTSTEALRNPIYISRINNVISYLFKDDIINEWLPKTIDFSTENSTNTLLAQIVLCSVLYRYIKLPMWKQYSKYCKPIGDFFISCMSELSKENGVNVRQFCTIPQILLYITRAIKE